MSGESVWTEGGVRCLCGRLIPGDVPVSAAPAEVTDAHLEFVISAAAPGKLLGFQIERLAQAVADAEARGIALARIEAALRTPAYRQEQQP